MSIDFYSKWICPGGLYKSCSPWCPLGWHAKSWESLVWNYWDIRAQSGDQNINGRFDQYHMWAKFEFEIHLNCVSLIPKVVISVGYPYSTLGEGQIGLGQIFGKMA